MKQQELERDYWVEVGNYSVGADLYEEGTWEIDSEGFVVVVHEDPAFYNYVWFYKGEPYSPVYPGTLGQESDRVREPLVFLILKNIYWNMKDN